MTPVFVLFSLLTVSMIQAQVAEQTVTKTFVHYCVPYTHHPEVPEHKAVLTRTTWDPETMTLQCYYSLGEGQIYADPTVRLVFTDREKANNCKFDEKDLSLHCKEK